MNEFIEKLIGGLEEKENEAVLKAPNTNDISNIEYQKWMMKSYGFKESIEIVNQLAEEYNNGWISVDDRLPTEEGSYLVVGKTGGATVTRWYAPSRFYPQGHFGGNSAEYIRYWMPRPEPPQPYQQKGE